MMRKLKIQPTQYDVPEGLERDEPPKPPPTRSRFVRLIPNVLLRTSSSEKVGTSEEVQLARNGSCEFEPSSVCLAKMVQNFMEDSDSKNGEKVHPIPVRCGRRRCNCFNGVDDSSDDEPDCFGGGCFGDSNPSSALDACDILKSLVPCPTIVERKLLADTASVVEKKKICKQRAEGCYKFVTDGLVALGYDASICVSRWEKTHSYPSGEYEYIDVVIEGERLLVDLDLRSEFEIIRPTKIYKTILQTLPVIFVGKPARLQKIISIATDAAKQSMKKKGFHIPPWRKLEYVKSKWLAPYTRISPTPPESNSNPKTLTTGSKHGSPITTTEPQTAGEDSALSFTGNGDGEVKESYGNGMKIATKGWSPLSPTPSQLGAKSKTGSKVVPGLASIMKD